jgi:hypothetical protein
VFHPDNEHERKEQWCFVLTMRSSAGCFARRPFFWTTGLHDKDVHFSRTLPGLLDAYCFYRGKQMAQKKSASKRSNGAEKLEAPKTKPKQASPKAKVRKIAEVPPAEPPTSAMSDEEIARKAYFLWESRGRPQGSPEEDWHKAKEQHGA